MAGARVPAIYAATLAIVGAAQLAPALAASRVSFAAPGCTVSSVTALAFGTISAADQSQDGRASFVVTCTRAQTVTISLLYSHHLRNGMQSADLTYDLYSAPNHASVWGSGSDGASVVQTVPAGRPVTVFIYARIPAGQRPLAGEFTDNIEIQTQAF
jgi:spore coat protein U-like protein